MAATYPVRVQGRLDEPLSRWLWLVKWVLVLPHLVVLACLWVAFAVLSVVAFVAIVVTGRYPRPIFDFNVGVLRWSWRVAYYSYGALGTDQYPPFTLADVPDYPARLDVAYPEHLSRGLVLVKTWLLAIPHYLVVGLFVSGAWSAWRVGDRVVTSGSGGLIGIMVAVAGVLLLVTGRYPRPIFEFVLGMNRWALRVAAYAGLMTDDYPPFRLDMGEDEPGSVLTVPAPPTPSSDTGAPDRRGGWTAGRVVSVVIGAILVTSSVGLFAAGAVGLWTDRAGRDASGFISFGSRSYSSSGYALAVERIHVADLSLGGAALRSLTGDVRVRVTSVDGNAPVFLGLAPAAAAREYLDGVAYTSIQSIDPRAGGYVQHAGGPPAAVPGSATFWTARSDGPGTQTLVWSPASGDWTLTVLNSDNGRSVAVTAEVSAQLPALAWVSVASLVLGLLALAAGVALVAVPIRALSRVGGQPAAPRTGEDVR